MRGHFIKYTENDWPKKPMTRNDSLMGECYSLSLGGEGQGEGQTSSFSSMLNASVLGLK
jgi:hypothetical protein